MTYKRDTLDLLKFEMNCLSNSYLAEIGKIILDVSKQSLGNETVSISQHSESHKHLMLILLLLLFDSVRNLGLLEGSSP